MLCKCRLIVKITKVKFKEMKLRGLMGKLKQVKLIRWFYVDTNKWLSLNDAFVSIFAIIWPFISHLLFDFFDLAHKTFLMCRPCLFLLFEYHWPYIISFLASLLLTFSITSLPIHLNLSTYFNVSTFNILLSALLL